MMTGMASVTVTFLAQEIRRRAARQIPKGQRVLVPGCPPTDPMVPKKAGGTSRDKRDDAVEHVLHQRPALEPSPVVPTDTRNLDTTPRTQIWGSGKRGS
jgi:hypothetical protein